MAKSLECIQGDSFSYDFSTTSITTFDANWGGSWAIVDAIPPVAAPLATGTIVRSSDNTKMELRVLPADTNTIPVGSYFLVAELTNATIGFNQEVMQESFKITAQGI